MDKSKSSVDSFWPFMTGLLFGFMVGFVICAWGMADMNKEHNAKYHAGEQAND